jgi:PUA domain protein
VPRFSPKEDVSGSTSLKSSVQRHIRTSLLEQFPLLSQPAYRENSSDPSPPEAPAAVAEEDAVATEPKEDVEEKGGKKKGGKGKGGGGKTKSNKKEKRDKEEEEDAEKDDGPGLIIDDIWPKKESLGLTKWCVSVRSAPSSTRNG